MLNKLDQIKQNILDFQENNNNWSKINVDLNDLIFLTKLAERYLREHKPENQCIGCNVKKKGKVKR